MKSALRYAGRGWAVFPLNGKRPFPDSHGHHDATTDARTIRRWWRLYPDANIGIRCDSRVGPIVLDIDGPEGAAFIEGLTLEDTLRATSGRRHRQHLYYAPNGTEVKRSLKIETQVDVLGDNGYVVAPPSIHPETGRPYRWLNSEDPVPFPRALMRLIKKKRGHGSAPPLPEVILEGNRDELLTSLAGSMRRRGASYEAIVAALREENERRCNPPLPDAQVRKIAKSISGKEPQVDAESLTDLGNARRFVQQFHRDVRHVKSWRRPWLIWDGARWAPDETGEADRLAKNTVKAIYQEAGRLSNSEQHDALVKHAIRSESASRIRSILELASTEPEIALISDVLDADPWLLNVENGTIDLRTGGMKPARRQDLITKMAPVAYDESADHPRWSRFLEDICAGNEELMLYLQRAVGYACTGDVREQCLFFCYGTGQNGKSTFIEIIHELLGTYAQQAEFSSFLQRRGEGPRNDLARMRGTRFVSAVEAPGDRSFDESILKQLTGGDTITARRLYEEFFEFRPTHKIFLAANHKPHVSEQSEAFWRRIRLIPFTVYIPPEKRDLDLKKNLTNELSGILNWVIQGCLDWQREGLQEPDVVRKATRSYREEEDLLGEFIEAMCEIEPRSWSPTSDLYQGFVTWWRESRGLHNRPPSSRAFSRWLSERHDLRSSKRRHVRGWRGISIRQKFTG